MKKRRIGRILIDMDFIDNRPLEIVEMLHTIKFLVYRAEALYASRHMEYIGISPLFDEIEPGYIPELYSIVATTNPETPGVYKYTVEKVG